MIAHFEVDVVQSLTGPQKKNEVHFEPTTMEPSPSTTVAMGRWHSRSVSRNTALSESAMNRDLWSVVETQPAPGG